MDPHYGRAKAGRPARTYVQQLCEDSGCSPEDLPEAMDDREKWWERVRDIRAVFIQRHTNVRIWHKAVFKVGPVDGAEAQRGRQFRDIRAVFILRHTNVRIWHKAVFKVGPVAGPKPNAIGSSGISVLYLSYVTPTYEYGTRPFLRWVLSQGRSPTR